MHRGGHRFESGILHDEVGNSLVMESVISKSPKDAQLNVFINNLASLYFVLTGKSYALFISPEWAQNKKAFLRL